jgi:hypothetical protein
MSPAFQHFAQAVTSPFSEGAIGAIIPDRWNPPSVPATDRFTISLNPNDYLQINKDDDTAGSFSSITGFLIAFAPRCVSLGSQIRVGSDTDNTKLFSVFPVTGDFTAVPLETENLLYSMIVSVFGTGTYVDDGAKLQTFTGLWGVNFSKEEETYVARANRFIVMTSIGKPGSQREIDFVMVENRLNKKLVYIMFKFRQNGTLTSLDVLLIVELGKINEFRVLFPELSPIVSELQLISRLAPDFEAKVRNLVLRFNIGGKHVQGMTVMQSNTSIASNINHTKISSHRRNNNRDIDNENENKSHKLEDSQDILDSLVEQLPGGKVTAEVVRVKNRLVSGGPLFKGPLGMLRAVGAIPGYTATPTPMAANCMPFSKTSALYSMASGGRIVGAGIKAWSNDAPLTTGGTAYGGWYNYTALINNFLSVNRDKLTTITRPEFLQDDFLYRSQYAGHEGITVRYSPLQSDRQAGFTSVLYELPGLLDPQETGAAIQTTPFGAGADACGVSDLVPAIIWRYNVTDTVQAYNLRLEARVHVQALPNNVCPFITDEYLPEPKFDHLTMVLEDKTNYPVASKGASFGSFMSKAFKAVKKVLPHLIRFSAGAHKGLLMAQRYTQ